LFLFDILCNLAALVHNVATHHELGVGQYFRNIALHPVVFVKMDREASELDVDCKPTVGVGSLVRLEVVARIHQL